MAFKKKPTPAARAASVMKSITSAERTAMQAVAGWGKTTEKAFTAAKKELATATNNAGRLKTRASNALARVQRAKAKQVKAIASDARKLAQAELASARTTLKAARASHATAKAAHHLYRLVQKGVASGFQAAEKAAQPKRLRRRLRKMVA